MLRFQQKVLCLCRKVLGWVTEYPRKVLEMWFIGWLGLLYVSWVSSGTGAALHLLITGTLSLTSVLGLPLPLFVVLVQSGWVSNYLLRSSPVPAGISVHQSRLRQSVDLVHSAYAHLKQVESDRYLGLDVDLVDAQDRFVYAAKYLLHSLDSV